jgi:hypothetical protein
MANYALHITDPVSAIKPTGRYDFIDTVRFRLQRFPSRAEIQLFHANAKSFTIRRGHYLPRLGNVVFKLVAPNEQALRLLATIDGVHINYLEIARDWILPDGQADVMKALFDQHFVQPWHGKRETKIVYGTTTYTGQRKRGGCNHFVWYPDKHCKLTGEVECFHLEGRYKGARAVRKLGINHPRDLLTFDYTAYWGKHLRLFTVDYERLGRHYRNRRSGTRHPREQCKPGSYNRDLAIGCALYRQYACHPDQRRYSVQRFVDRFGRGPFLLRYDICCMEHFYPLQTPFPQRLPETQVPATTVNPVADTSTADIPPRLTDISSTVDISTAANCTRDNGRNGFHGKKFTEDILA